jgi:hypothetical protein
VQTSRSRATSRGTQLSSPAHEERTEWVEIAAAVLLALATVATAWSSYQASRWNGEQAKIDVATFTQWVDAYAQEQTELADFYFQRFRAEFKPAVDAWIATRPRQNPDAPLTPFAMPEYKVAATEEANRLEAEAEALSAQARGNVQRATNYVLAVVLFAAALFFAGMSARLRTRRLRLVLLSFGIAVFVGTVIWLATFPISISV